MNRGRVRKDETEILDSVKKSGKYCKLFKYILLCFIAAVASLFISICIVTEIDDNFIGYIMTGENRLQELDLDDMKLKNYTRDGDLLQAENEDPQLILTNFKSFVSTITIKLKELVSDTVDIEVFYDIWGRGFGQNNRLAEQIEEGDREITLTLNRYAKHLRIDITPQDGLGFEIESITVINPSSLSEALKDSREQLKNPKIIDCFLLLFILLTFLGLHLLMDIKEMYAYLFRKRWIVAGCILLFLVINKYHGDSIGIYDSIVQPQTGTVYAQPILGELRYIRSDEWVVDTPSLLSAGYGDDPYGVYNSVLRGTDTLNSVSGLEIGLATFAKSFLSFPFGILGAEYAFSLVWFGRIILSFMMSLEIFYIISKKRPLLSVTGACLMVMSSYYLWWSFPSFIMYAQGALVCGYYFFRSRSTWKRIAFAFGVAVFGAGFATNLYPAWQVPVGLLCLCILIWMFRENWKEIKSFRLKEWSIIGGALLICGVFIITYLLRISEYTEIISNTVYPGQRSSNGGFSLKKIFNYFNSYLYGYKEAGNASESGVFLSFFPIPLLMAAYLWIREKKKDLLTGLLLLLSIPFLLYVTVGLPGIVTKVTLLSYSTPERLIDIVGMMQVYFIVIIFSRFEEVKRPPIYIGVLGGGITALLALFITRSTFPGYLPKIVMAFSICFIVSVGTCLIGDVSEKFKRLACYVMIGISLLTAVSIRPLSKGLDAIYSKPVAQEIADIMEAEPDATWVAYGGGNVLPGFAVACGAPTINSVNVYPNLELWGKLDPDGEYVDVYNRYSHVDISFTTEETSFELIQDDYIRLYLSYEDMELAGVTHILSLIDLGEVESEYVEFENIYDEEGIYIFEVIYLISISNVISAWD